MAIVQTLTKYSFIEAFRQSSRKDQFSYEALEAIFDYLEEYSDSTGEPVEFDIIAICCDWTEQHWESIAEYFSIDLEGCDDDEERIEAVRDYLEYETQCVELSKGLFVYVNF
jgi:acyl-homoserine lactone acylase PvdQ